jgi:serine protease Do
MALAILALAPFNRAAAADRRPTDDLPSAFSKTLPEGVPDLRAIQDHVKKVVDRVMPCVVGLQIGQSQGSGVIINAEGYILTAGHVSGQPGRTANIILPDGRKLKGVTLGWDAGLDSGLVKITEEGAEFPHVDKGTSGKLRKGEWVVAIGHPGGYQTGRPPVVRVGRVLETTAKHLRTDCTLVGGDSGGPLFDMHGLVVGVHSRIGGSISYNIHVPVDTYTDTWDRLAASEVWGNPLGGPGMGKVGPDRPFLGVRPDPDAKHFTIESVTPNSPAAKAGLRENDVIVRADDAEIGSVTDLDAILHSMKPGDELTLQIRRGNERITVTVTLGKRPVD